MFEEKYQAKLAIELRALAQSILENAGALTTSFQPLGPEDYSFSVYHPYTLIQDDVPGHRFISLPRPRMRLKRATKWYDQIPAEQFDCTIEPGWVDSIPGNEFMLTVTSPQFDNIATAEFTLPAAVLQIAC